MEMSKISVCFRLNGGIGTYLMQENFIQYFYEKFSDIVSITIYGATSQEVNDGLFMGQSFIDYYKLRQEYAPKEHDLAIDINWFPDVVHKEKRIRDVSTELEEIVDCWCAFKANPKTKDFVRIDSLFDPNIYAYTIACGKNRVNIMDINDQLGIKPTFKLLLQLNDIEKTLEKFELLNQKYITIQGGVNVNSLSSHSPKQWPTENYSMLCMLLKKRFPEIILVQVGESSNNAQINGVDKCLLGKTNFEELKVLLKNAVLHIDGECGMVHLRRALHAGPSVVLFGQTPLRVYGHAEDINLSANLCGDGCSKLFSAWKRRCYISEESLCMKAITPECVAKTIDTYLSERYQFPVDKQTKLQKLLSDSNIKLDTEWVGNWLSTRTIYAYWLEKIKIRDIVGAKLTPNGYIRVSVTELPAYQYMAGDEKSYIDYMTLNDRYNPGHEHSMERFKMLLENLRNGLDEKCYIAVDGRNRILDGAHRACWLAWEKGLNAEITVLKLYGNWQI